jgi:hypothetical protein
MQTQCKGTFTKGFISNKVCYAKGMFENKFQKLFLSSLIYEFKRIIFKPFFVMQISPLANL